MAQKESDIEQSLIRKLEELKYTYRPDIRDKAALQQNFRDKFEALNHVRLTDAEFARLRDEIINTDVFQATKHQLEPATLKAFINAVLDRMIFDGE